MLLWRKCPKSLAEMAQLAVINKHNTVVLKGYMTPTVSRVELADVENNKRTTVIAAATMQSEPEMIICFNLLYAGLRQSAAILPDDALRVVIGELDKLVEKTALRHWAQNHYYSGMHPCELIAKGLFGGISRTKYEAEQTRAIQTKIATRQKQPQAQILTLENRLVSRTRSKLIRAAKDCSYRQSQSKWVGGEHSISVTITADLAQVNASGASEKVWHSKRNWSGTNSKLQFTIDRTWLRLVHKRGFATIGGEFVLKVDEQPIESNGLICFPAMWACQSKGFGLKRVTGYIVKRPDGELEKTLKL